MWRDSASSWLGSPSNLMCAGCICTAFSRTRRVRNNKWAVGVRETKARKQSYCRRVVRGRREGRGERREVSVYCLMRTISSWVQSSEQSSISLSFVSSLSPSLSLSLSHCGCRVRRDERPETDPVCSLHRFWSRVVNCNSESETRERYSYLLSFTVYRTPDTLGIAIFTPLLSSFSSSPVNPLPAFLLGFAPDLTPNLWRLFH